MEISFSALQSKSSNLSQKFSEVPYSGTSLFALQKGGIGESIFEFLLVVL